MKGIAAHNKGIPHSEEHKKRISQAIKELYTSKDFKEKFKESVKGEKNGFYGKTHTEESKKKMSEKLKGRETWNKGVPRSEETKKKISESHKRRRDKMKDT